jgi:hypothetical protein
MSAKKILKLITKDDQVIEVDSDSNFANMSEFIASLCDDGKHTNKHITIFK